MTATLTTESGRGHVVENGLGIEIGRANEAMEQAENATFHAANVVQSHLRPGPERDALLAELVEVNNRMRAITDDARLYTTPPDEDDTFTFGPRWLSKAGRIWKRALWGASS
jgi:hypothetical protein